LCAFNWPFSLSPLYPWRDDCNNFLRATTTKTKKKVSIFSLVEKDDDYLHTPLFLLNMSGVITILKKKKNSRPEGFFLSCCCSNFTSYFTQLTEYPKKRKNF
jgi:hypothetical protein